MLFAGSECVWGHSSGYANVIRPYEHGYDEHDRSNARTECQRVCAHLWIVAAQKV